MPIKNKKRISDPRQMAFIKYYLTPGTKMFGSARASALAAGYSEATANNILSKGFHWLELGLREVQGLSENSPVKISKLAEKSRKVLDKSLDSDNEVLAQDTAKFISSRLDPEFAAKHEIKVEMPTPILGKVVEAEVVTKKVENGVSIDDSAKEDNPA